jgi:anthraniloyl-CoA monooxygenase
MARLAVSDQYDLLELNFTRESLPFKFISLTNNTRTDRYGGSLQHRMRFPLAVLDAVRNIWPDERPLAIRLSIPEQSELDDDELLKIVQQFREHGCDLIGIEIGDANAAHLHQRHLSDRICNELSIPTMLIGGAANNDEINTHILSGRTDLYLFGQNEGH